MGMRHFPIHPAARSWIMAAGAFLLTAVWFAPLLAADWQSLGRGTNRPTGASLEFFIDKASVRRLGPAIEFNQKAIYDSDRTTAKGITYRSLVVTVYMDCRGRKAADVAQVYYDRHGRKVHEWADFGYAFAEVPMPESFQKILPGSFEDMARHRLCR